MLGGAGESRARKGKIIWSSEYRSMADAWEPEGEEGRGKLRKAGGRSKHPLIPGLPNGVTRMHKHAPEQLNKIGCRSQTE